MPELVEPTEEEKRNGWTAKTLTAYLNECEKEFSDSVSNPKPVLQTVANSKYRPLRWRE